ncbi:MULTISPECIES: hypothetical protein [unclassified Meiothermus]|uniref:hypothetical protein n=1 Tax=unclassified Meiothermus TaxID=370471 RepID=UPI000D7CCA70|nr:MULTISPECIES: hypothetical protein [unclassified Meiothermus]PZA07317.1 hypothetical protein DNA98_08955 [Meiothermus sp. Pnk-1]RYM37310.1 hypothetical protein EWH23_06380 [Meiothermus sp. PNK-Is4]
MDWRLDQVIYWKEGGRVVVQVDLFDPLGRLRSEKFYPATSDVEEALERVALELSARRVTGKNPRVRQRIKNGLFPAEAAKKRFLKALQD